MSTVVPVSSICDEAELSAKPAVRKPELLSPAGDRSCLIAAVENGADAVYFGLKGHNARARAANFDVDELPQVMGLLHARGVRGYVTLNTLIFPAELDEVESLIRKVALAGVDAVIVQDLGLCRLIRALTPELEIHASTQMSVTSEEGVRLARELGCSRVILARELSLKEVKRIQAVAELPVEVFVHGALCVAYSGQCLTSEALGGRSANRGECAQACRMAYQIVCDGEDVDLEDVQYLLSPKDLAAYDLVPQLIELGVASLKIEGRLKTPEYVAGITQSYRRSIDGAAAGQPVVFTPRDIHDMEMSFSRGFSHGFLDGNNHKVLVRGDYAKKRGIALGQVTHVLGDRVRIDLAGPVKPGDGLVFDGDERAGVPEQGGRVYSVSRPGRYRQHARNDEPRELSAGPAELSFGRDAVDVRKLRVGQQVWKTDDPELTRRLRASFEGTPGRKVGLDLVARAVAGEPLVIEGRTATGYEASVTSQAPLAKAEQHPATEEGLREQLGRLGGTLFELSVLKATIEGSPLVPKSMLNQLRRELVGLLDREAETPGPRQIAGEAVAPQLRAALWRGVEREAAERRGVAPALAVLCRHESQMTAAIAAGVRRIYLDFHNIKEHSGAVETARKLCGDVEVYVATPRIQKPGEANLFKYLVKSGADGLLVRNAGGLQYCSQRGVPFVADFSLNAANELTVEWLMAKGAQRVTASYDLSFEQLNDLLRATPPEWLEVVIHQHMPLFHMEHCVYCAFLSPGTDKTNCGRPCDEHDVKLRDRVGMEHALKADVGCRNTLFNAVPQTAAEFLPRLLERGGRHLRIELLDDKAEETTRILGLYSQAIAGTRDAGLLWKELKAINRYGVTRGQLAVL